MTLRAMYGPGIEVPQILLKGSTSYANVPLTMDLAAEQVHMIGEVILPGGPGTSKLFSSAGGKIHWRTNSITWASATSNVRLSIQNVSTSTSPAQGDGTPIVYADMLQASYTLAANTAYATAMTNGSTTLTHGQHIAVCWNMTVRGGSDAVTVQCNNPAYGGAAYQTPVAMLGTPTFVRQTCTPTFIIEFDDGTVGWFLNSSALLGGSGSVAYNSGTAIADEYGNFFAPSVPCRAIGVAANINIGNNSTDFDLVLCSDPLGLSGGPTVIEYISVDATQLGNSAGTGVINKAFQGNITLKPGVQYGISVRPTSANNVTLTYQDVAMDSHWQMMGLDSVRCYAIRAINGGSFSDYNGGTAKTRRMNIAVLLDQYNDKSGNAQYHIGI